MKKMSKKQKIIISLMIMFMILTDILICFDNNIIEKLGYLCLVIVVGLTICYAFVSYLDNKKIQDQKDKKLLEEILSKKES